MNPSLRAPVIAGPDSPFDGLSVVHHVDGAGACRGVTHNEGDQAGVHLGHVVPPHTEEDVLTQLLPVLHSVADILGQGADQPATGHELVQSYLLEQPAQGRVQKLMLGKLVDFSIKWVGGVSLDP